MILLIFLCGLRHENEHVQDSDTDIHDGEIETDTSENEGQDQIPQARLRR